MSNKTLLIEGNTQNGSVIDGAGDGIFAFNNTSAAGTKATSFSGANVGIGTSAPVNTLHVAGTAKVDGVATVGNITITAAALATTVGAAGGASALPATPSGYIQITINGTPYKLPYYPV